MASPHQAGPAEARAREGAGFSSIIGQDRMKLALLLAAVEPRVGGVLIRGEKGTAKSSLVRGLAAILPPQLRFVGCPYNCGPQGGDQCQECRDRRQRGEQMETLVRPARVVELPLGASEDRVVGSIDWEVALGQGRRVFQPGLLAEANHQVLYVDEVNLLEHHLVDVLLDVAASGTNVVEREGISFSHPSQFVLVGTMNPEEGDLRPQLLDRFGLCVDVAGLRDLGSRVAVMERDRASDGESDAADLYLAATLLAARELLPRVQTPAAVLTLAATLSVDQRALGHRSDLVLVRAAQARRALIAAEAGVGVGPPGPFVEIQDLLDVAELALVHRRRSLGSGPTGPAGVGDRQAEPAQPGGEPGETSDQAGEPVSSEEGPESSGSVELDGPGTGQLAETAAEQRGELSSGASEAVPVEDVFEVARLELPKERLRRRGSGRRSKTSSKDHRGRYVAAREVERTTDLALDATLRAAAPHQASRRERLAGESGRAIELEAQDLRQKVRQRRIGNLIVFVVDASASMDAERRMSATRSAILALLKDAYVRRDRVALISFSGRSARIILRPTSSVDLAERHLSSILVGGTTPLTHGLVTALDLIKTERMRDPEILPLLVLISDGRGNISFRGEEPLLEAQRMASQVRRDGVRALVIDSSREQLGKSSVLAATFAEGRAESLGYHFNACVDLAERMGGQYFGLFDLSEGAILRPVNDALRQSG